MKHLHKIYFGIFGAILLQSILSLGIVQATPTTTVNKIKAEVLLDAPILFEEYILRVRNEDGRRLGNAFVTLMINERDSDSVDSPPPMFVDYTYIRNGIYRVNINPSHLEGKRFTLTVHLEGYYQYKQSFSTLRNDITVILKGQ